ncbi:MAG: hypothetical protein ACETVW_06175 [Dehalococcoidia bacterium]|nr:hypothetical protein [Dehalococcoidia bacterium]
MKDKLSIGLMIYFLAFGTSMVFLYWGVTRALALLLSIPVIGGAILAFYIKMWGT